MRIATLIIGIFVVLIVLLQSCAIGCLGAFSDSLSGVETASDATTGGALGVMAGVCGVFGVAFVLKHPFVSVIAFLFGALFAGMAPKFGYIDGGVWAWALGLLAVFAFFGYLGLRREKRQVAAQD